MFDGIFLLLLMSVLKNMPQYVFVLGHRHWEKHIFSVSLLVLHLQDSFWPVFSGFTYASYWKMLCHSNNHLIISFLHLQQTLSWLSQDWQLLAGSEEKSKFNVQPAQVSLTCSAMMTSAATASLIPTHSFILSASQWSTCNNVCTNSMCVHTPPHTHIWCMISQ